MAVNFPWYNEFVLNKGLAQLHPLNEFEIQLFFSVINKPWKIVIWLLLRLYMYINISLTENIVPHY